MTRKYDKHETMDPIGRNSDREAAEKFDRLRSSLLSGRIGRRDFMVSAIALGLSTTAASSVFNKAWAAAKKGRPAAHRHHRRRHQRRPGPRAHPGFVHDQRAVRSGPQQPDRGVRHGRAGPGARGELGLHPRREDLDVQDPPGCGVPQRQVSGCPGRRRLHQAPSDGGFEVRGKGNSEGYRVGRGRRQARSHGQSGGRRRRLPVPDERLSCPHLSLQRRRHHRLAVGHRDRRVQPGRSRAGHPHADQAQPELLEGGQGALRRSGDPADCRSERKAQCPANELRRLHQQRGPEDRRGG